MTFSYTDNVNRISSYINENCFIQSVFGNALFISIIISCLLIIIINININNKTSQVLYSFITTFFIILVFNKIIKLQYLINEKKGGDISFIGMMENNISGGKINIIKPLDMKNNINTVQDDVEKFLNI